jgi:hypothetical protein
LLHSNSCDSPFIIYKIYFSLENIVAINVLCIEVETAVFF